MDKNKGIIGIVLIIAIVLGIVVVGVGAYYLGTKKNTKVIESPSITNKLEENNSHEVPTGPYGNEADYVAPARLCKTDTTPWIQVLSPNGGEVFTAGQKVSIKWKSCNVKNIYISMANGGHDMGHFSEKSISPTQNSFLWTVPNISGSNYAIGIDDNASAFDTSDGSFTINSPAVSDLQLTEKNNGQTITSVKGQTIIATLCNPGDSGYQFDAPQYDTSILSLTSHTNVPIDKGNPPTTGGCYGNDVFKFQALKTGTTKLIITATRPWVGGDTFTPLSATIKVN